PDIQEYAEIYHHIYTVPIGICYCHVPTKLDRSVLVWNLYWLCNIRIYCICGCLSFGFWVVKRSVGSWIIENFYTFAVTYLCLFFYLILFIYYWYIVYLWLSYFWLLGS